MIRFFVVLVLMALALSAATVSAWASSEPSVEANPELVLLVGSDGSITVSYRVTAGIAGMKPDESLSVRLDCSLEEQKLDMELEINNVMNNSYVPVEVSAVYNLLLRGGVDGSRLLLRAAGSLNETRGDVEYHVKFKEINVTVSEKGAWFSALLTVEAPAGAGVNSSLARDWLWTVLPLGGYYVRSVNIKGAGDGVYKVHLGGNVSSFIMPQRLLASMEGLRLQGDLEGSLESRRPADSLGHIGVEEKNLKLMIKATGPVRETLNRILEVVGSPLEVVLPTRLSLRLKVAPEKERLTLTARLESPALRVRNATDAAKAAEKTLTVLSGLLSQAKAQLEAYESYIHGVTSLIPARVSISAEAPLKPSKTAARIEELPSITFTGAARGGSVPGELLAAAAVVLGALIVSALLLRRSR